MRRIDQMRVMWISTSFITAFLRHGTQEGVRIVPENVPPDLEVEGVIDGRERSDCIGFIVSSETWSGPIPPAGTVFEFEPRLLNEYLEGYPK